MPDEKHAIELKKGQKVSLPEDKSMIREGPPSHDMYHGDLLFWQDTDKQYMLLVETDDDVPDPRKDADPLSRLLCRHSRRSLGDYPSDKDTGDWWAELVEDAVPKDVLSKFLETGNVKGYSPDDPDSDGTLPEDRQALIDRFLDGVRNHAVPVAEWMKILDGYAVCQPVWAYEHSGITISAGKREYPFNDRFDSGQLGWIAVLRTTVMENWPDCADWELKAVEIIDGDIGTYDQWLNGDVYWFRLYERAVPADGEEDTGDYDGSEWTETDSCGGFYGSEIVASGMAWHVGHGLTEALDAGAFGTGTHSARTVSVDEFHRD